MPSRPLRRGRFHLSEAVISREWSVDSLEFVKQNHWATSLTTYDYQLTTFGHRRK